MKIIHWNVLTDSIFDPESLSLESNSTKAFFLLFPILFSFNNLRSKPLTSTQFWNLTQSHATRLIQPEMDVFYVFENKINWYLFITFAPSRWFLLFRSENKVDSFVHSRRAIFVADAVVSIWQRPWFNK